ncbi:MAG: FadR/GntR family transcriptional regulator [Mangrovibacterium sp.]|jgi:DNA-binding FadR family transcriptional regulator
MTFYSDKIKSITLVDQVEEQILNYINKEKLKSGSDIPSEIMLAEELNVGRNVIREALSRLRMLGIIESRKHKGMVLREPDVMKGFSKVINPYLLSKSSILDLLDFRVSIESGITELIIANITDEDIQELEHIVAKHVYQDDVKLKAENEIEFHSKLYRITGNQAIIDFQKIVLPLFNYVNLNLEDFKPLNGRNKEKPVKHEDLLIHLKNRDIKGYREAIYNHLKAYSEYTREYRKRQKEMTLNK